MEIGRLNALILADDKDFNRKMDAADKTGQRTAGKLKSTFSSLRLSIPDVQMPTGGFLGKLVSGNLISDAIKSSLMSVAGGMKDAWQAGIEYNKMLETGTVRMGRFFQTAQQTDTFVSSLQKFAQISPIFEMPQALTGAQRLLDMKVSADKVIPSLVAIGDAVGGTGGNAETLDRVTLALSQMHTAGKITGEDMRQLTEANIPAWELLARAIGKTEAQTKKLVESGGIKADRGLEGIIAMMGDKFAGQSEKAGKTLAGQESQFTEAYNQALSQATQKNFEQLKQTYAAATDGLAADGAAKFGAEVDKLLGNIGSKASDTIKGLVSGESFKAAAEATKTVNDLSTSIGKAGDALQQNDLKGAWSNTKQATGELDTLLRGLGKSLDLPQLKDGLLKIDIGGKVLVDSAGWGKNGIEASKSLAAGLQSGAPGAEAAGKAVGKAAEKGVRDALDQHSPSRVMLELGKDAAQSFWDGFNQTYNQGQSNITDAQAKTQFGRAEGADWVKDFKEAAKTYKVAVDVLMAIASRETNMRNIIGDRGRGAGVMQVDVGTDAAFKTSGAWKDAGAAIMKGAEIFSQKIDQIVALAGKEISLKDSSGKAYKFTVPKLEGDELTRVAIAAYNSGMWGAYHASKGRSPDQGTTGGDYSADVLGRAEQFRKLLETIGTQTAQAIKAAAQTIYGGEVSMNVPGQRYGALPFGSPLPASANRLSDGLPDLPIFAANVQLSEAALRMALKTTESFTQARETATTAEKAATSQAGKFSDALQQWSDLAQKATDDALARLEGPASFERFQQFKEKLGQGFDDIIGALVTGGTRWQDVAKNVAVDFFNSLASEMMMAATGGKYGSLGGLLGGVVGGLFGGLFHHASGGPVRAGEMGIWNEPGSEGELFVPTGNGYILNRRQAQEAVGMASKRGGGNTYNININVPITAPGGQVSPKTRQQIAAETAAGLQFALSRNG